MRRGVPEAGTIADMTDTAPGQDELRAIVPARSQLGLEYDSPLIESFLTKVEQESDARVDARLD
ncbi:MAG: hypothetical protein ACYDEA_07820 [Candidatus Dormibacteria bacterium]